MRILISSLACSLEFGSESLVGFRSIEALATRFPTTLISSRGMSGPTGVELFSLPVRFSDPNDASPAQLLKFERLQRAKIGQRFGKCEFDVMHRMTPSGYKESLLPVPSIPLVLGPVLGSDPHPAEFSSIFRPTLKREYSPRALSTRIRNGVARRVFARQSTLPQLLEHASLILVGTQVTLRRLPEHLLGRSRLLTYAGVEHETFRPAVRMRVNKVPQLLFAGRIVPYKGVELLLRAAAVAKKQCRFELKLVGGGDPAYTEYCKQLAARLGLTGCTEFLDNRPRSELVAMYQAADVFCMPSIETYGIAILEAMSSGCAVLVSDINGPGEIVLEGTGLKVPLETPEQFVDEYAERLVQLVEDAKLREELGQRAREQIIRHHDWKQIQSRLLEIYDEFFPQPASTRQQAEMPITTA